MVGLQHYLILGAVLFVCGLLTILLKRNAIGILMGVELILNSANINYIAFARYSSGTYDGQIFAVFVIMLAAAEAAIGLAILVTLFRNRRTIDVADIDTLKG